MKYVYMLRAGEQYYKVGIASNIYNRLKSFQTANPSKIEIVTTNLVKDPARLERDLHRWLEEFKADGGQEWFKLNAEQALELAIRLNNTKTVDLADFITLQNIANMQANLRKEFVAIRQYAKAGIEKSQESLEIGPEEPREKRPTETVDMVYEEAVDLVKKEGRASTSFLQRKLRLGYGRASRIMDRLEEQGIIGALDGAKPRVIL